MCSHILVWSVRIPIQLTTVHIKFVCGLFIYGCINLWFMRDLSSLNRNSSLNSFHVAISRRAFHGLVVSLESCCPVIEIGLFYLQVKELIRKMMRGGWRMLAMLALLALVSFLSVGPVDADGEFYTSLKFSTIFLLWRVNTPSQSLLLYS